MNQNSLFTSIEYDIPKLKRTIDPSKFLNVEQVEEIFREINNEPDIDLEQCLFDSADMDNAVMLSKLPDRGNDFQGVDFQPISSGNNPYYNKFSLSPYQNFHQYPQYLGNMYYPITQMPSNPLQNNSHFQFLNNDYAHYHDPQHPMQPTASIYYQNNKYSTYNNFQYQMFPMDPNQLTNIDQSQYQMDPYQNQNVQPVYEYNYPQNSQPLGVPNLLSYQIQPYPEMKRDNQKQSVANPSNTSSGYSSGFQTTDSINCNVNPLKDCTNVQNNNSNQDILVREKRKCGLRRPNPKENSPKVVSQNPHSTRSTRQKRPLFEEQSNVSDDCQRLMKKRKLVQTSHQL